jgi:hypothetical protein
MQFEIKIKSENLYWLLYFNIFLILNIKVSFLFIFII